MSTLKEKFENIHLEKIPANICFELETIRDETSAFEDADALEIFSKNFNFLYSTIQKKHPDCLKDYIKPPPTKEELEEKKKKDDAEKLRLKKIADAKILAEKYGKKTTETPAQ